MPYRNCEIEAFAFVLQPFLGVSSLDLGRSPWCIGPFFCLTSAFRLFGRLPPEAEMMFHMRKKLGDDDLQCALQAVKPGSLFQGLFVHIQAAIDLDLKSMLAFVRRTMILSNEAASIRFVPQNPQAMRLEPLFGES